MKNINPDLKAHLAQEVTTLCACIDVVRTDGISYHFTDHDVPVLIDNVIHFPQWGFSRTSILSSLNLEIDNLEIAGVMKDLGSVNPLAVSREEIEAGLFDFASVYLYLVNYEDPSMGKLSLRRGWIGEIQASEDGAFHAEVRGLTQVLAYRLGEAFTPTCRANLGDSRCAIVLDAPVWEARTTYNLSDRVLGHIGAASDFINLNLVNGDFEGSLVTDPGPNVPGWVSYGDSRGQWSQKSNWKNVTPQSGATFIIQTQTVPFQASHFGLYQDIDLIAAGLLISDIDTGLCRLIFNAQASTFNGSKYQLRAFALNVTNTQIGVIWDSGLRATAASKFVNVGVRGALIPPGTRKIRFDLFGSKPSKNANGNFFDNVRAAVNNPSGTLDGFAQFGGVAFLCTQIGVSGDTEPTWDNVIGDTFTDGSVVWRCVQALAVQGQVNAISSGKQIQSFDLTQPAGWFDDGVLRWVTGPNAGRSEEVQTYDGVTLKLLFRPFYQISLGDTFTVYPGCQKTFSDCKDKFNNVLNFRGEPKVPGMDVYITTPNVPSS